MCYMYGIIHSSQKFGRLIDFQVELELTTSSYCFHFLTFFLLQSAQALFTL